MILVVGSTGDLGGRVVRLLREQGQQVRAMLRPGADEVQLRQRGADVVWGDLTDPDSLPAACRDIEVVISTATAMTTRRRPGGHRHTIDQVDRRGMAALIDAGSAIRGACFSVRLGVVARLVLGRLAVAAARHSSAVGKCIPGRTGPIYWHHVVSRNLFVTITVPSTVCRSALRGGDGGVQDGEAA